MFQMFLSFNGNSKTLSLITRPNVFCLRLYLNMWSRSWKMKRDSNAVSGCRENRETLWQVLCCCKSCILPFSRQSQTPFESRFVFSDWHNLNIYKRMQRQKTFGNDDFRGGSPLVVFPHEHSASPFLGNHWSLLSPVLFFQTNSTPINVCKGREPSAARIGDVDFRGCFPLVMLLPVHSVSPFSR
jgi:hypothetical protein